MAEGIRGEKHRIVEYESDFMEDGYYAVCSCGWKSPRASTMAAANDLHQKHVESQEEVSND